MEEIVELKLLSEQKENDWKVVVQKRLEVLERDNAQKRELLEENEFKMTKLKEDFKYNLKLLHERDEDLHRYEKMLADLKSGLNGRVSELSDVNIRLDEARTALTHQEVCQREVHRNYQLRLREKEREFSQLHSVREDQMKGERTHYEMAKQDLEQRLNVVKSELQLQKQELMRGFDETMVKREHEHRLTIDELATKCLEHDLKNQLLVNEMEMLQAARVKDTTVMRQTEATRKTVERHLKETEWTMVDVRNTADYRVKELEDEIGHLKSGHDDLTKKYNRKQSESERALNETKAAMERLKTGSGEREAKLCDQIREITTKLEQAEVAIRQAQWGNDDLVKEREVIVERFQNEIDELKSEWGRQMKELGRTNVDRDLELGDLRDKVTKLNDDLLMRKGDITRYKKEVSASLERESESERRLAQLEVEWRRRYEDAERIEYSRSEELVERLTRSTNEALATVREKDRLMKEKDRVIAALQGGAPLEDIKPVTPDSHQGNLSELQQQNKGLRDVISQMRAQMVQMSLDRQEKPISKGDETNHASTVRDVGDGDIGDVGDNPALLSHLQSLNNQIGSLRSEKLEMMTQIKKQQVRLAHLTEQLETVSKQPREKQVQVDQLRYELSALERRLGAECESLRERGRVLGVELTEAQQEARQYHRGNLEKAEMITQLENQLSSIKVDMAKKTQPVSFGAQELLIKQLQDELHHRHPASHPNDDPSATVIGLRDKLRMAARTVLQLTRDKQQLIQLGNGLRAQLAERGNTYINTGVKESFTPPGTHVNPYSDPPPTKLSALETLQYQLTKKELHFAQLSPERGPRKISNQCSGSTDTSNTDALKADRNVVMQSLESSCGVEGLQEVWDILDQSSPSVPSARSSMTHKHASKHAVNNPSPGCDRITKHGSTGARIEVSVKTAPLKKQYRPHTTPQISRPRFNKTTKAKVRNYNVTTDPTVQ